jgi:Outer membrane protein beta-barrel domain
MKNRVVAYMGTVLLTLSAGYAYAIDQKPGDWEYGFYAGAYLPDPSVLDTGPTGGMRIGYRVNENIALSGSLGYTSLDGEDGSGSSRVKADLDAALLDFNAWYIFFPEKRLSLTLGAGAGYAWGNGSFDNNAGNSINSGGLNQDSPTYNFAIGPIFRWTDRLDLRLMTRFRYFTDRQKNDTDREVTLAIVFPLQF